MIANPSFSAPNEELKYIDSNKPPQLLPTPPQQKKEAGERQDVPCSTVGSRQG